MATAEQIKGWLDKNQDKAGTTDFVTMTEEYRKLTGGGTAPAESQAYTDQGVPIGSGTGAGAGGDPYGAASTTGRIVTGAATGIPDLAIALGNAGVRAGGSGGGFGMYGVEPGSVKEAPYIGPMMNRTLGVSELPADASTTRRLLEGGGSALLGGGANAVRTAVTAAPTVARSVLPAIMALTRSTAAPTVASHYGGQAGSYIADKLGLDPQTGGLLGSLFGGTAVSAIPGAIDRYRHNAYADMAHPDAPNIARAAAEEGVTPTAGMLGNDIIKQREKNFAGEPGASNYTSNLRRGVREDIGAVIDRAAAARGATNPTPSPGDIGYDAAQVARVGAGNYQAEASRRQQDLMDLVGPRSGTDIQGVIDAMNRVAGTTDPLTRAPIQARVNALRGDLPRDAQGNILSTELPYEVVKDARSGLRVAGEGYGAVAGRHAGTIENAMTDTMRNTAVGRGVSPDAWDRTQQHYASTMGEGGPHETLTGISNVQDPMAAYNFVRQGEQAPGNIRTLQATGLPEVNRVLGDYMRMMANNTINTANSRGPVRFADKWQGMAEGAGDAIAGPQRPQMDNAAVLSRAYDYPPNQMGTSRMLGAKGNSTSNSVLGPAALGWAAEHMVPGAGAPVAAATKWGVMPVINNLRARALQSPTTLNALGGGAAPGGMTMADLVAALNAVASQQQRRP
jgi:hypothetical protein